jgi:hypothetical protein
MATRNRTKDQITSAAGEVCDLSDEVYMLSDCVTEKMAHDWMVEDLRGKRLRLITLPEVAWMGPGGHFNPDFYTVCPEERMGQEAWFMGIQKTWLVRVA